jgi:hypothetical protein
MREQNGRHRERANSRRWNEVAGRVECIHPGSLRTKACLRVKRLGERADQPRLRLRLLGGLAGRAKDAKPGQEVAEHGRERRGRVRNSERTA